MKKYVMWLTMPFLLSVTYFLFLTGKDNEYSTVNYTDMPNNVPINRVSGSLRRSGNETGVAEASNADPSDAVLLGEYQEELPAKNDGANALAFTHEESVMDSETVIISNDCEIIIPDDTLIELPAGTIIEKTDTGTLVHVGPNGALLTRADGTVLDFPPDSVMEFRSIHSMKKMIRKIVSVCITKIGNMHTRTHVPEKLRSI